MDHKIPLPRGWKRRAKSAIIHILALSHYTFTAFLASAAQRPNSIPNLPDSTTNMRFLGRPESIT